jgi:hypothetical protein
MVPIPTFEKLRFRFHLHIYTIKSAEEKNLANFSKC